MIQRKVTFTLCGVRLHRLLDCLLCSFNLQGDISATHDIIIVMQAGVALLESVDAIMTGVAMPFVCLLELVALMYVYRSHDFVSDMNVATEENACASRIGTQWQMIPAITLVRTFDIINYLWSYFFLFFRFSVLRKTN